VSLRSRTEQIWYGREEEKGAFPLLLAAASGAYRLGLGFHNSLSRIGLKRERRLDVPCVSVGNLVVGGTGKTPTVSWIVDLYRAAGVRAAVISRGYGGSSAGPERVIVGRGEAGARRFGDEPVLLAERHPDVPVIVGRDRCAAAAEAVSSHGAEILVADDAFQHRRMSRDLNIAVADAGRWFGNRRLFPRGPLREPPEALGRADVVLLNRVSGCRTVESRREEIARLAPRAAVVEGDVVGEGWHTFDSRGQKGGSPPRGPVYGFCGLANPGVFRRSLEEGSLSIAGWRAFPDHYRYDEKDLEDLAAAVERSGAESAVTTAKDAARISSWPGRTALHVLDVRLEISRGREEMRDRLLRLAGGGKL
jgi:tetraacyldisaccharide 4'-kinase